MERVSSSLCFVPTDVTLSEKSVPGEIATVNSIVIGDSEMANAQLS